MFPAYDVALDVLQLGRAAGPLRADETGHFVRWSVKYRHARDLTYGTVRWTGPLSTIDREKRWADAGRLLTEGTPPAPGREPQRVGSASSFSPGPEMGPGSLESVLNGGASSVHFIEVIVV